MVIGKECRSASVCVAYLLTAVAMAYFEIAYAWMRVQLKTVFGNFLKEVFHRVGVMLFISSYLLWYY